MDNEHTANGDHDVPTNRLGESNQVGDPNRITDTKRDQPANQRPGETSHEAKRVGERYTVQEAAEALGTTVDAVRGRIRRGTLTSVKEDGVVYVLLGEASRDRHGEHSSATAEGSRPSGPSPEQAELAGNLRDQIEWLRREVERKDTIIMQMAQRIPELEPATEPRGLSETAPAAQPSATGGTTAGTEGPQEPARQRSWLYRFFFGPS